MLNVIVLSVIMLSVVMLGVMAPKNCEAEITVTHSFFDFTAILLNHLCSPSIKPVK